MDGPIHPLTTGITAEVRHPQTNPPCIAPHSHCDNVWGAEIVQTVDYLLDPADKGRLLALIVPVALPLRCPGSGPFWIFLVRQLGMTPSCLPQLCLRVA